MIDLRRFSKPITATVPIRNSVFIYNHKKYALAEKVEDAWYLVELENNKAKVIESNPLVELRGTLGFTYNNSFIFQNFDVAKKKWGFEIQKPLYFNSVETFSAIKALVWEDKEIYFLEPNYADYQILEAKGCFDEEKPLKELKGLTPELRTVYLFHSIERDNLKAMLTEKLAEEEHEQKMREVPYRLKHTLERAGAQLEGFSVSGDNIIIDWSIPGNPNRYNSVISKITWMVEEAGYCLAGGDRKLNLTSLVKTADEFEEGGLTYITRR